MSITSMLHTSQVTATYSIKSIVVTLYNARLIDYNKHRTTILIYVVHARDICTKSYLKEHVCISYSMICVVIVFYILEKRLIGSGFYTRSVQPSMLLHSCCCFQYGISNWVNVYNINTMGNNVTCKAH